MLEQFIIIIHVLSAIAVVALILLQHGKGADVGASFGSGASQTVLGVQGGGNLLTHATAILATVFFVTSLSLGYFAKQKTTVNSEDVLIEEIIAQPGSANDEIPVSSAAGSAAQTLPAETETVNDVPAADATVAEEAPAAGEPAVEAEGNAAATEEIPE